MTASDSDLVSGGNVVDPQEFRVRMQARAKKQIALFCYGITVPYFLFWVFSIVSTIMGWFIHFSFGTIIIGAYSSVSLLFVARAASKG